LGQWTKGKSTTPSVPRALARHKDEIPDVQKLSMWLDVQRRAVRRIDLDHDLPDGEMHFLRIPFLTLLPGDIVTTARRRVSAPA